MDEQRKNIIGRRSLLLGGAFLTGALSSFGVGSYFSLESVVAKQLDYLSLAPGVARQFVSDYKKRYISRFGRQAWMQRQFQIAMNHQYFPLEQFLMSTDFFQNGADESRTIQYVEYFDRSKGCANPFANLDELSNE